MIVVEDIEIGFEGHAVLKGLNLKVTKGETYVIMGTSGSGKSVLLKVILGILCPTKGRVLIDDIDVTCDRKDYIFHPEIRIGMLFQGGALFDSMNVGENVAFYLKEHLDPVTHKRLSKKEIKERVEEALGLVSLSGIEEKLPSELSGGMRKRVALARSICYNPDYIFYDEPTTGLDPLTAQTISELIVELQEKLNATSLVVTHDIASSLYVADRIGLLINGEIAIEGTPMEFINTDHPTINFFNEQTGGNRDLVRVK